MSHPTPDPAILDVNAVTLATRDMRRAVRFYRALGFRLRAGGENATFSTFSMSSTHLNLIAACDAAPSWWGRVIFFVSDVDAVYEAVRSSGFEPLTAPRDAEWGERYFHVRDPDGHELSFARPLRGSTGAS